MKKILLTTILLWTVILSWCLSKPDSDQTPVTPVDINSQAQDQVNVDQPEDIASDIEVQTPQTADNQPQVQSQPEETVVESIDESEMTKFTMEDIATHGIKESCWIVVNGYVYDVTDYITKHPWWEAIIEWCGKEATELFNTRPMGSGTPHSQKANDMLRNYLIWKVSK